MIVDVKRLVAILGADEHGSSDIIKIGLVGRSNKPLMTHTAHNQELLVQGLDFLEYPFCLVGRTHCVFVRSNYGNRH